MRSIGVICEFNPFHTGHAYLLARMREAVGGNGCVICALSGRFIQRGASAMFDPYLRAAWALSGGADLVVELPFPHSAASAEHFAAAGVHILASLGVGTLAFGSESADRDLLLRAANAAAAPDFASRYAELCRGGMGAAAAYASAIREMTGDGVPSDFPCPNDILGIAYLTALQKMRQASGVAPDALVVLREGAHYGDDILPPSGHPSATALRRLIIEAACDPVSLSAVLEGHMPDDAVSSLVSAVARGDAPIDGDGLLPFFHAYYRLQRLDAVEQYAECGGGITGAILRAARETATPEAFFASLCGGHYTDARLRRALLFGAVGVRLDDLRAMPTHTILLGANERGRAYLREWQKASSDNEDFKVITKPADAPHGRRSELAERADGLFTLCYPTPREAGATRKMSPVIR